MKKLCLFTVVLALLPALALAEIMPAGPQYRPVATPQGKAIERSRQVPEFTFTKLPTSLIINYYDYMIGAYNSLPLKVIPTSAGGGYFLTYHCRRQATSTRRQFYAYLDAAGSVINNNEITSVQNHEGFGALAIDPVTGKPMYAWHANADSDSQNEVEFTSDAFIAGIAGLFNDIDIVADNPTTITTPEGITTDDNEFIWPCVVIGPSPVAGKRRVYVGMRNSKTHAMNNYPSENMYIAYADYDGDDIELGNPLSWNHTTIPEMDTWNHTTTSFNRPAGTLVADNAGNLYWAGHHTARDGADNTIRVQDMDVFVCPNYGQGTWTRYSDYGDIPTWNPDSAPSDTTGYWGHPDLGDIPYGDNGEMFFGIINSGHLNAVRDANGRIHVANLWCLRAYSGYYYPAFHFVKEFVYDPSTHNFTIKEIYPQQDVNDTYNLTFTPWDMEAPWGEVDQYGGDNSSGFYPITATAWPFPHWDQAAHTDAMMFHYNNVKLSEPNDQGMMVCVWQDSERARMYNQYNDTEYASYANTPEIWISVSPNNGGYWSEPIIINNVDTPQFAGIKPMYVYPADKVIYVNTTTDGQKVGKIGMLFYNDYTWGSHVNSPAYHPNPDGGEVMFMELQITFPPPIDPSNDDNSIPAVSNMLHQNYPNPFNPSTTIVFDMPAAGAANLSVYNLKGQLVKTLANENKPAGRHSFTWDGTDSLNRPVSSGIYFYRLTAAGHTESKKMVLVK